MNYTKLTKTEISWALYDVANSAFIMIVTATIPIYFRSLATSAGVSAEYATSIWGSLTSLSVMILALLAPILGALADYQNMRKRLFSFFLIMGIGGAIVFSLVNSWIVFLVFFVIARIGYAACNIFYDAMLVDVASDERMDRISSFGYAFGYIGSTIPFIIGILIIFKKPFGLSTIQATQVSFLITVVWWLLVSIPLLKNVQQKFYLEPRKDFVSNSFIRLEQTFSKLKKDKCLLYFILGYFFYIDGVYTIISMATTYGGEVGIDSTAMILALLLTQFVAFPCCILSGRLAECFGALKLLKIFIVMYIGICIFGTMLNTEVDFWILAVAVGVCQGGVQALSRSQFGKMIPKEEANEYFGFFEIFGKCADFLGPMILAFFAFFFHSSRFGILALVVLFIIGLFLLYKSERYTKEI